MPNHQPLDYRPDGADRNTIPADVCDTCSDFTADPIKLVPASFCPLAHARLVELYPWEQHRIQEALNQLDGTTASAVSLLADIPKDQLDDYGGTP